MSEAVQIAMPRYDLNTAGPPRAGEPARHITAVASSHRNIARENSDSNRWERS